MVRYLQILAVITALLFSRPIAAGADDPGQQLFQQGRALYLEGYFELAVERLRSAEQVSVGARLKGQVMLYLGLSHHAQGELTLTRKAFRLALGHDPSLVLSAEQFKPSMVTLFREVKQKLRGRATVTAKNPFGGHRLFIDGGLSPSPPLQRSLSIGPHEVVVRSTTGRVVFKRQIVVYPDKEVSVQIDTPAITTQPDDASNNAETKRRGGRLWTWVAVGVAAASLGAGVGLGLWGASDHEAWLQEPPGTDRADQLETSGKAKMITANVLFGLSALSAAAATVLFFVEGRSADGSPSRRGAGLRSTRVVPVGGTSWGLSIISFF